MTREEASSVLDDYDVNFDGHTAEEIAEAFDVAFRALEQEPCEDAVSRKSVIAIIQNHWWNCRDIDKLVNKLPSVTPQEPFKPMVEIDLYSVIKQKYIEREVLDKIRAEIEEVYINITYQENKNRKATWGLRKAMQIIDKYKPESEDKQWQR